MEDYRKIVSKIQSLTPEELALAAVYTELTEKAENAVQLIKETYRSFGIGEEKIIIKEIDGNAVQTLYHNGDLEIIDDNNNEYHFNCTKSDEFFEYFCLQHLVNNKIIPETGILSESMYVGNLLVKFLEETKAMGICL